MPIEIKSAREIKLMTEAGRIWSLCIRNLEKRFMQV